MAKFIAIDCQFCGEQNRFYPPSPAQLGARRPNSHLMASDTNSIFGGRQKSLKSDATTFPQGDYEKSTPIGKLDLSDILVSLADASIIGTLSAVGAGGTCYAIGFEYWPVVGGLVGFGVFFARYSLRIQFAETLTKAVESFTSNVVEIVEKEVKEEKVNVSIDETTNDGRHFIEDEISNPAISIDDLKAAAAAVYPHPHNANQWCISRARIEKQGIPQDKARMILEEFKSLNYAFVGKGKKTVLTLRGHSVLKELLKNGSK